MKKVRITSINYKAHLWEDSIIDDILYSGKLSLQEADGLLAIVDPTEELLIFKGPKLWYTYEPSWHYHYRGHPIGKKLVRILKPDEWAYFANKDERYRVPHSTHIGELSCPRENNQTKSVVAVVSNYGGRLWFLRPHIWLRNIFILNKNVELFGKMEKWSQFRHFPLIWKKGLPSNYKGPPSAGPNADEYILFCRNIKYVYVWKTVVRNITSQRSLLMRFGLVVFQYIILIHLLEIYF
ncbi:hypothetical protein NXS98_00790 [Fontisphaera persica]|uniref:hypothetical protein n=1 Tax=Fontisphaera persica TaxID=2974023 RepID=UPI0024BFC2F8|nr:hypothetical protein [Fontisphaera persica]WCJ59686.1 hypothetical protein NXS98_00790 [Fontisphaera persica]